ncbi:unnamed protein product, partial [Thelazia callipaeda]|uniref:Carn_acyltransf domain-containing protein n=1 Tax=Thelazia callipaeda TaxID=103827 RepID=A0A0N5CMJ3_THECL
IYIYISFKVRTKLCAIGDNSRNLTLIDSALFAVCLDNEKSNHSDRVIQSLLSGDDARNRWFDKSFQLIVDARGLATINFEHSWGDGVALLRLMKESFCDTKHNHFVHPNQFVDPSLYLKNNLRHIEFTLTDSLRGIIQEAQEKHSLVGSKLSFGTVEFFGINRQMIKCSKLSPDSILQLAIQLAFYRLHKRFVPTYESCSTAAFLGGRTECIRSATVATSNAVLAIDQSRSNVGEHLKKCTVTHSLLVKEAATGQGFDRHLMGLRITADRLGWIQPELFNSEIFKYMNQFVISTSTLSTDAVMFGGFGPVTPDGYGIGYNVFDNKIGAVITSYQVNIHLSSYLKFLTLDRHDAKVFANALLESLDILKNIIHKKML